MGTSKIDLKLLTDPRQEDITYSAILAAIVIKHIIDTHDKQTCEPIKKFLATKTVLETSVKQEIQKLADNTIKKTSAQPLKITEIENTGKLFKF